MRGLTFIFLTFLALAPGCALFESGVEKASGVILDGVGSMLEAKVPEYGKKWIAEAKEFTKAKVKEGAEELTRQSGRLAQFAFLKTLAFHGVDGMDYDADLDGVLDPIEMDRAQDAAKREKEKQEEEKRKAGEFSWWQSILGSIVLGGGALASTWGKSAWRTRKERHKKEIREEIKNGTPT